MIMAKFDPREFTTPELLRCYADLMDNLKERNAVRTYNSPVADFAEWLVAQKLKLSLERNSNAGYDATGSEERFQIKCRRLTPSNNSRQLSVIRNLGDEKFDYLIGVVFERDFTVKEAYKIPHGIIADYAKFSKHQNGHILQLKGDILRDSKVEDITHVLKQ